MNMALGIKVLKYKLVRVKLKGENNLTQEEQKYLRFTCTIAVKKEYLKCFLERS